MIIGICTLELDHPDIHSLKQKRSLLKGLIARIHKQFNVSCAEIALHDVWKSSTIAIALITNSAPHAQHVLENIAFWIEKNRPDITIVDYQIELIQ